jgi:ADP-ribose pyrophosphatase
MKKLPDNAKLMFEGVRYNVWQWEQQLFDGSTVIFEAASRADCVTIIGTVGDKILVLQEEQPGQPPFLALPGGHCEGLDSAEKTAKYKLELEAGYKAEVFTKWFVAPYGWVIGDNHFFIAKNVVETGNRRQDPGDKITPKLITFDEFLDFRKTSEIRNRELLPMLERAANNAEEKQKLYDLLFSSSTADIAQTTSSVTQ